jgi:hypothetical protein
MLVSPGALLAMLRYHVERHGDQEICGSAEHPQPLPIGAIASRRKAVWRTLAGRERSSMAEAPQTASLIILMETGGRREGKAKINEKKKGLPTAHPRVYQDYQDFPACREILCAAFLARVENPDNFFPAVISSGSPRSPSRGRPSSSKSSCVEHLIKRGSGFLPGGICPDEFAFSGPGFHRAIPPREMGYLLSAIEDCNKRAPAVSHVVVFPIRERSNALRACSCLARSASCT